MLNQYVDHDIGDWIVTNEDGEFAILMIKDIHEFCDAVTHASKQRSAKKMRNQLERSLRCIEFAPVKVKGNGKINWASGEFVQEDN
jgi:hypothetical protein